MNFVTNYFHELPIDVQQLIYHMIITDTHNAIIRDIVANIRHYVSFSNPCMSFVKWVHMDKLTRYSHFKATATLIITTGSSTTDQYNNMFDVHNGPHYACLFHSTRTKGGSS